MQNYQINVAELQKKLQAQADVVLLDVRTEEERQAFNIGGIHIPINELPQRTGELDKNKEIIAYCRSGVRSLVAVQVLVAAGFHQVKSLTGGILAWQ